MTAKNQLTLPKAITKAVGDPRYYEVRTEGGQIVKGRLEPLRTAWQSGELTPLLCAQSVEELLRVLAYPKFKLTPAEHEELLTDYLPYGEVVAPWQTKPAVPEFRDEKDQIFLDLAAVGAAQ